MNAHFRNGGQCVYCAFRTKRLALESLRLRRYSTKRLFHSSLLSSKESRQPQQLVRNVAFRQKPGRIVRKHGRPDAIEGSNGIIRKHVENVHQLQLRRDGALAGFEAQLEARLEVVEQELSKAPLIEELRKEKIEAGQRPPSFEDLWKGFVHDLTRKTRRENVPFLGPVNDEEHDKLLASLSNAFEKRGVNGLDDRLRYTFYTRLISPRFTSSDITNQRTLADLRYPSEWYPATRRTLRTVHLHVGPTNSGKTYHALQRLEQADSGIYAGPLRLLAHEVYTRMNAKGRSCALVTGEERRMADPEAQEYGDMAACTVEMVPLNRPIDVAIIDEIQMIGNAERGWAWTQAFLGVRAKEVHLCGEERTVPLVQEICASLGETLHIHRYQRLSPLEMESQSLNGRLKDLRKGDCIVSFSIMGIHALRQQIERATGKKVATVYGSLPPETRAQQARLFNDPDNEYDYLVASDAVGMGLNLAIKRIIFEASNKYDGYQRRTLNIADIKQIAGRAGRYKIATFKSTDEEEIAAEDLAAAKGDDVATVPVDSATPGPPAPDDAPTNTTEEVTTGLVTTLERFDYPIVRAAMNAEPEPIRSAGLFPPSPILERFASYFPPYTPFSYILTRLHELSQMHPRFHLCGLKDQVWIADLIEGVSGLTITDRNIICSCPASMSDKEIWVNLMPALAKCIADQTGGAIFDIDALPLELLEADVSASRQYLRSLEQLHKGVVAYLWLSYRFAGIFYTRSLAFHIKSMVEAKIEEVLNKFSFTEASRRRLAAQREKEILVEAEAAAKGEQAEQDLGATESGEAELDESGEERTGELDLHEQTSVTSGGDHFGGEEDIGYEEPLDDQNAGAGTSSATSPDQETNSMGEGQNDNAVESFSTLVAENEEEAFQASRTDEVMTTSGERPSLDAMPESELMATEDKSLSPEQDSNAIEVPFTHEIELESDSSPLETQLAPPVLEEPRVLGEELESSSPSSTNDSESAPKPAGFKQFGAGVPPKHLAQLELDAKEPERDLASRP